MCCGLALIDRDDLQFSSFPLKILKIIRIQLSVILLQLLKIEIIRLPQKDLSADHSTNGAAIYNDRNCPHNQSRMTHKEIGFLPPEGFPAGLLIGISAPLAAFWRAVFYISAESHLFIVLTCQVDFSI